MNGNMPIIAMSLLLLSPMIAEADCVGCVGDIGIQKSAVDIWGTPSPPDDSTHTHDFSARCDAVNLAGYTGEVSIMITVEADLEGTTKYVTANFISGSSTTAITSGNGFINAPSDGKFFKTGGVTSCGGEKNRRVVTMDYDVIGDPFDCTSNAQCRDEDGLYCNGDETCGIGTCQASSNPCSSGEYCDETLDVCISDPVCSLSPCP